MSVSLTSLIWRAKKAHERLTHKLSEPPFVPGIVPRTNWVCPWDKLGLLCKIRRNPGLSLGQSGFVTGTNPVCPWDNPGVGPRATGPKCLCFCAFFLPH